MKKRWKRFVSVMFPPSLQHGGSWGACDASYKDHHCKGHRLDDGRDAWQHMCPCDFRWAAA